MEQFKGQKILVVEDNLISYKLIEAHLKKRNLHLIHAENGFEAIEAFRNHPDIQVVLMDIQLPEINCLEVTKKLCSMNPDIPVIATTANAFDEDRIACEKAGCKDFITKPISFPLLIELIKEYTH